ncbi:MAG: trigger factor [Pseudohongiellaceae bacterium]
MQISVKTTEGLERKMTVTLPSAQINSLVDQRLQSSAAKTSMKGFRKGKVPIKVLKNKFGKGIRKEVIDSLLQRSYSDAIAQEKLKPAAPPDIEIKNIQDESADLEYVATFEVVPELSLPDFSTIKVEQLQAEVEDSDIDEMVETLRRQRRAWQPVERAAATGDWVNYDCRSTMDGKVVEDATAKGADLELGSGKILPGLEEGITGKSAGDNFTLPITFPADYPNKQMAGKTVQCEITLNTVKEPELPKLNDEFFITFGVKEGGEQAFRKEVAGNMERELKRASKNKLKRRVEDEVAKLANFPLPSRMVATEIEKMRAMVLQRLGNNPKHKAEAADKLPDEMFQKQAEQRVTLSLMLQEVVQQQNMKPDSERVKEAVEELAATYESPDEVVAWYYRNEDELFQIQASVLHDQVIDYIVEQAQVSNKTVSYQEAIRSD